MPNFVETFGDFSASTHGFVVSSLLLSATFASLLSGTLSDNLGRTRALAAGALVFTIGAAIEAGSSQLGVLILGRLIVGIGEGLFLSTLVVYVIPSIIFFPTHGSGYAGDVNPVLISTDTSVRFHRPSIAAHWLRWSSYLLLSDS
jgi:MFS family permease